MYIYIYTVIYIYICLYFSRVKLPFKCSFPVYIEHHLLMARSQHLQSTEGDHLWSVAAGYGKSWKKRTEFFCKCQLALMFYLSIHPSIHLSIYRSIYLSIHLLSCPVLSCPVLPYPILSYPSKIYTIYHNIYIYIVYNIYTSECTLDVYPVFMR